MAGLLKNAGTRLGDGSVMRIAATLDPATMDIMVDDNADTSLMPVHTRMSTRTSQTMREGTLAVVWKPEAKKAFGVHGDDDQLPHLGVFANALNVPAAPPGTNVLVVNDKDDKDKKKVLAQRLCRSVRPVGEVGREFTVGETDAGSTAIGTGTFVELIAHRTMAFPGQPPGLFAPVRLALDTAQVSDGRFSIEEVSSKSQADQAKDVMAMYLAAAQKSTTLSPANIAKTGGAGNGARKTATYPVMKEELIAGNKMLMGILGIVLAMLERATKGDSSGKNMMDLANLIKLIKLCVDTEMTLSNKNEFDVFFAFLSDTITPQMSVYSSSTASAVIQTRGLDLISNAFFDLRESNRSIGVVTSVRAKDDETYQADVALNTIS